MISWFMQKHIHSADLRNSKLMGYLRVWTCQNLDICFLICPWIQCRGLNVLVSNDNLTLVIVGCMLTVSTGKWKSIWVATDTQSQACSNRMKGQGIVQRSKKSPDKKGDNGCPSQGKKQWLWFKVRSFLTNHQATSPLL